MEGLSMAIARKELVQAHNPELFGFDYSSPMLLGNGEFAFSADVTGLQTFYDDYQDNLPLCTMSQWGLHTENGQNVHRFNLGRIAFNIKKRDGSPVTRDDITSIHQEMDLYDGVLYSRFKVEDVPCAVRTCVHPTRNMVAVEIHSELITAGQLYIEVSFPYAAADKTGSDWNNKDKHLTETVFSDDGIMQMKRTVDEDAYFVTMRETSDNETEKRGRHLMVIKAKTGNSIKTCIEFSADEKRSNIPTSRVFKECETYWNGYWENGGIIRLRDSRDPRALMLERRVILSQFLTAAQCAGTVPAQKTGLTCNGQSETSDLATYFWNSAHFHFWGRTALLEKTVQWYIEHPCKDHKLPETLQGWLEMIETKTLPVIANNTDHSSNYAAAMAAVLQGQPKTALDILLNVAEEKCSLPDNGGLLLAVAMMAAGYTGCVRNNPGFPDNGDWTVEYEGIRPFCFE